MEQIIIKDGKIIEHLDAPELIDGAIEVSDFNGYIGSDKGEYDSDWKLLPLHDRVSKGFVITPKGYRCEGDRFIEMTEVEKVEAGILTLPEGFMVDNGIIRAKTVEERFGALYKAFKYGTPPHAGAAPGLDRMVMLIADTQNIREIIAFPKNKKARDVMMNAPSKVDEQQLKDVHIKIDK